MTSRERVLMAFAHAEPDRVPAWCGASVEFWAKAKKALNLDDEGLRRRLGDDFRRIWPRTVGQVVNRTPFGIRRSGYGYGQAVDHPLAEATLKDIDAYPWPNPADVDVSLMKAEAEAYGGQYAVLGGAWSPFWHDAIDLFGMEQLYLKMYDEPALVDAVLTRIVDYYLAVSQAIFDAAGRSIDIFFIGNDFGGQTGPLLSEKLFRRFLLPHLRRLVELGHAYRLKVMLHCCGGFAPLIPALVEIGVDGLHAVQSTCHGMDLANLKAEFGHKILFNGCIDSHHILIKGDLETVRRETARVVKLMMPGGGFIAGASHDSILEETPVENVVAMFDTIQEVGVYR
ncbi:MAG: uroporphyrinogen decarboxylase family protein [Kiritimatiellae bacterium]|nr:uroporphyrinogen decarboxylase family protein [Kiritimatiellia bacterium]